MEYKGRKSGYATEAASAAAISRSDGTNKNAMIEPIMIRSEEMEDKTGVECFLFSYLTYAKELSRRHCRQDHPAVFAGI